MLRKLFVAASVALGLAGVANAATITYTLDKTVAGQFSVYADVSQGDNFGLVTFGFQLTQTGGNITSEDNQSPWGLRTNFSNIGFADIRVPLSDGATNPDESTAAPTYIFSGSQQAATGATANFVYGLGQSAGSFTTAFGAAYNGAASAGLDATNPQSWNPHLLLATGTYTGLATNLHFATTANNVGNVWAENTRTRVFPSAQVTLVELVPEPATASLFGLALVGCVGFIRRRSA
jgi:hypothetical protein